MRNHIPCRCCFQPLDAQKQERARGGHYLIVTCWNPKCGMNKVTSVDANYHNFDLSGFCAQECAESVEFYGGLKKRAAVLAGLQLSSADGGQTYQRERQVVLDEYGQIFERMLDAMVEEAVARALLRLGTV